MLLSFAGVKRNVQVNSGLIPEILSHKSGKSHLRRFFFCRFFFCEPGNPGVSGGESGNPAGIQDNDHFLRFFFREGNEGRNEGQ